MAKRYGDRGASATGGTLGVRVRLDGCHAVISGNVIRADNARVLLTRSEAMDLMADLAKAVAEHDAETAGRTVCHCRTSAEHDAGCVLRAIVA